MTFRLSPRLAAAAAFVDGDGMLTDVGTDHAYLPAYLVLSGKCSRVLACDIGALPLKNAAKTVADNGLEDRILLRISDGLCRVSPEEAAQISVCGLGGTQIVRILSAADWIRRPGQRLILQPMTHLEDVREFLCGNGFSIIKETYVFDESRYYCCLCAEWTGTCEQFGSGYCYFGEMTVRTPEALAFYKKQIDRIRREASALQSTGKRPEDLSRLLSAIAYYEGIMHEGE